MSILGGLRPNVADTYSLDQLRGTEAWDLALDHVAEALTNPTDEQVEAVARGLWEWESREYPGSKLHDTYEEFVASGARGVQTLRGMAEAALAAAAGGDQ